ncbi:allene oxide synthase-lipoxygenase protein-like [Xenia sp. Carnegie-2017]|uniref:allene oxide synthase-lipoxygenase protein-like n=1 Tax=Xenia sp. Carnegie-2017 TaxID=2897299 RepID=UPI001F03CDFC|nr:allene oxide synthase-lipoxygenase protein-like [Xenia sp. Carnegie-2017]XP_046861553.1 allene oxide synthase-lipoxygenase protein-like [Xenia sp. Carnegie-2017]XP_046861555.1 allene oxide synthase-lipoxygenase protein-like [Xenia sp. Carnegie-2017]
MPGLNLGFELFAEKFGKKELERRIKDEHTPPRKYPIFGGLKLELQKQKFETMFTLATMLGGFRRATHTVGTGGVGKIKIVDDPKFPEHEFFKAGRQFDARLRHGNLKFTDDAGADARSFSIKFADADDKSPLDIVMNTGEANIFWDVSSLDDFVPVNEGDTAKEYVYKNPYYYYNFVEALRRAPDSFAHLYYYSQLTMYFKAKDGKVRYCRYRAVPGDINIKEENESGRLTADEQRNIWIFSRHENEKRPDDYLRKEYVKRLKNKPITYHLQIQIHDKSPEDTATIFHAGILWDKDTHPWLDLATVTIKTRLSPDVIERTTFNIVRQPESLGLLEAESPEDYNSIGEIRVRVYDRVQMLRKLKIGSITPADQNAIYTIEIKTGNRKNAGTDATVYIRLTGLKGRTEYLKLDKSFHNDFKRGSKEVYRVEALNVGEIELVELNARPAWITVTTKDPDWFVEKVTVMSSRHSGVFSFPCYRWVINEIVLLPGKATLPFHDMPPVVAEQRQKELKQRKEIYQWDWVTEHMPGSIKAETHADLPRDVQFTDEKSRSYKRSRLTALANLGLSKFATLFEDWDNFDDYKILYHKWLLGDLPVYESYWDQDRWFAYQFLNSANPVSITRCDAIPKKFPVTDNDVKAFLDRGKSLKKEIKKGHIYIVDYEILVGCKTYGGPVLDDFGYQAPDHLKHDKADVRYCAAPIALFYVNKQGHLMPIAIQINQEPGPENPIWTPHEPNPYDWMLAKLWLRVAESNFHQLCTHLLRTHLTTEPFALSTWRNLSSAHPIFKLLQPHIYGVLAIDTIGRKELIGKGGIVDLSLSLGGGGHVTFMEKCFKQTTFQDYNLPKNLKKRGVNDPSKLPEYYYRDDGLALWEAIEKFVGEIVGIFYKRDDDVKKDDEIQNWILDVYKNGWRETLGNPTHDLPAKFESREQLVELLTCLIFTFSCQHAAVNFSQKDHYGFTPNAPAIMRKPPPNKKGEATLKSILSTLPNKSQAVKAIATVYILTKFSKDERYLGNYSCTAWEDLEALGAISRFQNNLENISEKIKKRNKDLEIPYIYLLPERVPNGTAI